MFGDVSGGFTELHFKKKRWNSITVLKEGEGGGGRFQEFKMELDTGRNV